jgi:tRNA nucleotidyltransferase/poly(A) polymerase
MQMFEVGGCVRDELLGLRSKDIDFSVVLDETDIPNESLTVFTDPFEVMVMNLEAMGFNIFLKTPEHLTVRAQFPKNMLIGEDLVKHRGLTADFVLARKEGEYSDGRRPDHVEPGTLADDLARRDFTMNAIAKDAEGNLIDPHNGVQDINDRVIRAVGNPLDRLNEDALRAVRALRFSVTLGFRIDKELEFAMETRSVLDKIENNISDERIQVELSKMLRQDTVNSLFAMTRFPALTLAMFAGRVSLDSTLKTKGRGK